jgi:hypothetical protein
MRLKTIIIFSISFENIRKKSQNHKKKKIVIVLWVCMKNKNNIINYSFKNDIDKITK